MVEIDPLKLRTIAKRTCTDRELDALALHLAGAGYRRVALELGIAVTTARDRIARATRKINDALEGEK